MDDRYSTDLPAFFKSWFDFYIHLERADLLKETTVQLQPPDRLGRKGPIKVYQVDSIKARCFEELYPKLPTIRSVIDFEREIVSAVGFFNVGAMPVRDFTNNLKAIARRPIENGA